MAAISLFWNTGCLPFTIRFMVWVNGSQSSGLVNFVPQSPLPFVQISSIYRKTAGTGIKDGFEGMEHEFPFGIFHPEKQDYPFRCSVAPKNFPGNPVGKHGAPLFVSSQRKICLVYNTCGYFASCVVFFQAPQGVRKNTSNGRNVRSYYMLNHRIRGLLFHYKKELLFCNWLPLFLVRVFRNILIPSVRITLTMSKMCERFEPRSHFKSRLCLIVGVNVVLNRTVVVDSDYSPHGHPTRI